MVRGPLNWFPLASCDVDTSKYPKVMIIIIIAVIRVIIIIILIIFIIITSINLQ